MAIFQFVSDESERPWAKIVASLTVSGIAVIGVLAIANAATRAGSHQQFAPMAVFALCAVTYAVSFRYGVKALTELIESSLYRVRLRLCERIRSAELYQLEQVGLNKLYTRMTQQTTDISNSTWSLAMGAHSMVLIGFTVLYVTSLSLPLLVLVGITIAITVPLFLRRQRQATHLIRKTDKQKDSLFATLTDLLQGAKEVRLHAQRGDELLADFHGLAAGLKDKALDSHLIHQRNYIFVTVSLFLLIAATVWVLPQFFTTDLDALNVVTSTLLFLIQPVGQVISTLPEYERASLAAQKLRELEEFLTQSAAAVSPVQVRRDPWKGHFAELRLQGLRFAYAGKGGEAGFSVGPIDLSLKAGQIIFIVGGNGSGKTTLLKLLAALYTPSSGRVLIDGVAVDGQNSQAYREMIAAIFTDFHLFKKLYGLSGLSKEEIEQKLKQLELADQTSFIGNRFTRLELSTGQRKRLAMIVALLEDRPLYIFDEWAADQDPRFRRYYYEELLPGLKRLGKTILAISHDDRYFHCADLVIQMESGTIRSLSGPASDAAP